MDTVNARQYFSALQKMQECKGDSNLSRYLMTT